LAPPLTLGYPKTKKLSASGGLCPRELPVCPWTPLWASSPDHRAFPLLEIYHYITVTADCRQPYPPSSRLVYPDNIYRRSGWVGYSTR